MGCKSRYSIAISNRARLQQLTCVGENLFTFSSSLFPNNQPPTCLRLPGDSRSGAAPQRMRVSRTGSYGKCHRFVVFPESRRSPLAGGRYWVSACTRF
jgi:hypothetical protein